MSVSDLKKKIRSYRGGPGSGRKKGSGSKAPTTAHEEALAASHGKFDEGYEASRRKYDYEDPDDARYAAYDMGRENAFDAYNEAYDKSLLPKTKRLADSASLAGMLKDKHAKKVGWPEPEWAE